jgi:hypothetical protein
MAAENRQQALAYSAGRDKFGGRIGEFVQSRATRANRQKVARLAQHGPG